MDHFSKQERAAMLALWKTGKGSIHDILDSHEEPKPHKNTLTSTLKNLEKQQFIGHRQVGSSYEYFPVLSKKQYMENNYKNFLNSFFDNSVSSLLSFIVKDKKLTKEDVEKIRAMIEKK